MIKKLPVLFLAHGNPMNVILDNSYTKTLKDLGKQLERPKAIMVISSHWKTEGISITYDEVPKQIYDFYGFPEELYNVKYTPSGSKEYADLTFRILSSENVKLTDKWGLDHAAWGVLKHMYPDADIPVFEMSLNALGDEEYHYNIGNKLSKLRESGVLIIASGNIVHNLPNMNYEMYCEPFKWANDFDKYAVDALKNRNHKDLIEYKKIGKVAKLSVPTDEHYIPLLYLAALDSGNESIEVIHQSIQHGSMSMTCIKLG